MRDPASLVRNTIDFSCFAGQPKAVWGDELPAEEAVAAEEPASWYVLLLVDGGHTNIVRSQAPQRYLQATAGAAWQLGMAVEIGKDEESAQRFMELVSTNARGKQIRGALSRATNIDLLAQRYAKPCWANWPLLEQF